MSSPIREESQDLSAVAWVRDELRRSLENAHKAIRRFLKEHKGKPSVDKEAADTALLRQAATQLHQGVGVLELVNMPEAAAVLRASESAIQRLTPKVGQWGEDQVKAIERASFGVLDYLSRKLAGKNVSAVCLYPQYKAVQEIAEADRVHPADLWSHEWRAVPANMARSGRKFSLQQAAVLAKFQQITLAMMRNPEPATLALMSDLCEGLSAGAADPRQTVLWQSASAVYQAQSLQQLPVNAYTLRLASRLLAQLNQLRSGGLVSDRLILDLLFFCAAARSGAGSGSERLAAVLQAQGIHPLGEIHLEHSPLGLFDPALLGVAAKRIVAAKEVWSGAAAGEGYRLAALEDHFVALSDALAPVMPQAAGLSDKLQQIAVQIQRAAAAPGAALSMEVATALLYLEAVIEDGETDGPAHAERLQNLANRLDSVVQGGESEALEPWMEDLYRRMSDRQTMGSVVDELRNTLREAEAQMDAYMRHPEQSDVLKDVPGQLISMRGVLSVLGMDAAAQATVKMRDDVESLLLPRDGGQDPKIIRDRLAENLGALGFLIDMLGVQAPAAKSLFVFDSDSGLFKPVMGRKSVSKGADAQDLNAQVQELAEAASSGQMNLTEVHDGLERLRQQADAADQGRLASVAADAQKALTGQASDGPETASVAQVMGQLTQQLSEHRPAPEPTPAAATSAAPVRETGNDLSDDQEMLDIFIEEAREVIANAQASIEALSAEPADVANITTVRRAFHTLKGSSRMVGLKAFGEAAWSSEQVYNTVLSAGGAVPPATLRATPRVLTALSSWVESIARSEPSLISENDVAELWLEDARGAATAPGVLHAPTQPMSLAPASVDHHPSSQHLPTMPAALMDAAPRPEFAETSALEDHHLDMPDFAATEMAMDDIESPFEVTSVVGRLDDSRSASRSSEPSGTLTPMSLSWGDEIPAAQPPVEDLSPAQIPVEETPPEQPLVEDLALEEPQAEELLPVPVEAAFEAPPLPEIDLSEASLPVLPPVPAPEEKADRSSGGMEDAANDASGHLVDDQVKIIGPLQISIPLFNIFLSEADEKSRLLSTELAEWAVDSNNRPGESPVALAHSLAGSSAAVGFTPLSHLARTLEHELMRVNAEGLAMAEDAEVFTEAAEEIRRLLHQFAVGFLKDPSPALLERLSALSQHAAEHASQMMELRDELTEDLDEEPSLDSEASPQDEEAPELDQQAPALIEAAPQAGAPEISEDSDDPIEDTLTSEDAIDPMMFLEVFAEEAQELLDKLSSELQAWVESPRQTALTGACMRTLHTFKGSARMAGANRLGERAHRMESRVEQLASQSDVHPVELDDLLQQADALSHRFEHVRQELLRGEATPLPQVQPDEPLHAEPMHAQALAPEAQAQVPSAPIPEASPEAFAELGKALAVEPMAKAPTALSLDAPAIDWSRFGADHLPAAQVLKIVKGDGAAAAAPSVRVRASLLDHMVNAAGEVAITKARLTADVLQLRQSLGDLTGNLDRLRGHLRDIELQAETQMLSRQEAAKAGEKDFDPLEFDRFTRFQEVTRMMAESVNDVATVQRSMQRTIEACEDELAAQTRMTRDLQDGLLSTRMVEFDSLTDRLARVVRGAARETGKQVRLEVVGGQIEIDRSVLERTVAPFEHLLRNSISHGIEAPEQRALQGKPEQGLIRIQVSQVGNEVEIEVHDDGAGLDFERIREKGLAAGLIPAGAAPSLQDLARLIFESGFSTATSVTSLSGRGVGMDVVKSEVQAMGGRVDVASTVGVGTVFKLQLPLTTAVTHVLMVRAGHTSLGVPTTLVEAVRRGSVDAVQEALISGEYVEGDVRMPIFWLGGLLYQSAVSAEPHARTIPIIVIRSAQQRVAVVVDEVLGNQEVVVKNLGAQLSNLPGLAGMTILASGAIALIYNPVALATLFGASVRESTRAALTGSSSASQATSAPIEEAVLAPLVMVVDDSVTVRRVTQRLLQREGFRVVLAKDGLDALEQLQGERPRVILSDIEMPRMDGFDFVRNVRSEERWRDLPVIMITSRMAQKHRDHARELGVDHYLGKPYNEEELMALVKGYTVGLAAV